MGKHELIRLPGGGVLYDPELLPPTEVEAFDPERPENRERVIATMSGRGQVQVLELNGLEVVLRHFRRGGLLGRLRDDTFVWTGLQRSRIFREWHLLRALHERGLPVPRPVAARVLRRGLLYRGDIMTLRLPGTESLAQRLKIASLPESQWRTIGATLRRFHEAGAYHADLNAMNILMDTAGGCHVIDWDKGQLRNPRPRWQHANLRRLRRSLERLRERDSRLHFGEADWDALMSGYRARP
ncbi:3-deoxy-D-manno-octulosonic acid kinase [Ectothiorhodospiraceae bacterium WFHF3C12]|nr:3-deoxy-D-manno-octulosonic acid kinase [Ectothiorhodospiraceae bacterium WFHF3C12]